jgi:tetratricopeptide (TPR) repeat protein
MTRTFSVQGKYAEAESEAKQALQLFERHYGPDDLRVADVLRELGRLARFNGYTASGPYYRRALAIRQKAYGSEHPEIVAVMQDMAIQLGFEGHYDEAQATGESALAMAERLQGPDSLMVARGLNDLSTLYRDVGKNDKAVTALSRALVIAERTMGKENPRYALLLTNLGAAQRLLGRLDEGLASGREALAINQRTLGPDSDAEAVCRYEIAQTLSALSRLDEAHAEALRAEALFEKTRGRDSPYNFQNLLVLGSVELKQGQAAGAVVTLERARQLAIKGDLLHDEALVSVDFALARALVASQQGLGRARELATAAHAASVANRRLHARHDEIDQWLRRRHWQID